MADLRFHATLGNRPLAEWLGNVCTSAFMLQHVVRISYSGDTVLALCGVAAVYYDAIGSMLQSLALVTVVQFALDQLAITSLWGSSAAIAAFVDASRAYGGTPAQQHVCHQCGECPNLWFVAAVGYHSVLCALFAMGASVEASGSVGQAYGVAVIFWQGWLALLLGWAAVLGGLLNRRTNVPRKELQKLVGVAGMGAAVELPMAMEEAFPVPPQHPIPLQSVQSSGPSTLFRFDQLRVR